MHTGVDFNNYYGEPIKASADGVVTYSGWRDGYGNVVTIDHGNGFSTLYAHCSKLLVKQGQKVSRGDIIAKVGDTGTATSAHLHFEIRIDNNPINPLKFLDER